MVENDPEFKLSPLFRTIYLKPIKALDQALPHLAPYRHYLQTIALAVAPERSGALADAAIAQGALRVVKAGEMSGGHPGEPHDGQYGLHELVRWVSLDTPEAADAFDGTVFLAASMSGDRPRQAPPSDRIARPPSRAVSGPLRGSSPALGRRLAGLALA